MAEAQNKKKASAKGRKVKKGSQGKRSFFFRLATIILSILATLLLVLGILYLARVQYWFAPSPFEKKVGNAPTAILLEPVEEYDNISRPRSKPHQPIIRPQGPVVAIIVDDLGADPAIMQNFLDLHLNLTAAVLPNLSHSRVVAELAHANGREVLLHIPMEPKNYPAVDPGEKALLVDLSSTEIDSRLRDYLLTVPWVVGANNHMGSRFTESHEGMREVLKTLKMAGLFFVDSRTTADTVAIAEAKKGGIAYAERDLFLDNDLTEESICRQLRNLIAIAKEQGSAIGICHPHIETLAALRTEATSFAAAGVNLVAVSALLH